MKDSKSRKGIILAGGRGMRLHPITLAISKQIIPIYDKPMIYYPISTLMLSGIREFLIITTPKDQIIFKNLLGNGNKWGLEFEYAIQERPNGVAEALLIGEQFIGDNNIALILGDNLFHGNDLISLLQAASSQESGSTIFAYPVSDPERYGVVVMDKFFNVISIKEKPVNPKSKYAVTGLYFFDNSAVERSKDLEFSSRGELEITALNEKYLQDGLLKVVLMGRGMTWLDTGTVDSLHEATSYIRTLEHRQGLKIGCPEEIAWRKGWITDNQLADLAHSYEKSGYGKYLSKLLKD